MKDVDSPTQIIDCTNCESKVQGTVIAKESYFYSDWMDLPSYIFVLKCTGCDFPIVGHANLVQTDSDKYYLDSLSRVWPNAQKDTAWEIPKSARDAMNEASRCFNAKAYNACVVMCGRALEAICKDHEIDMRSLMAGLRDLKEKGVIDGRLFEWGNALREARNVGAHATESETTRVDARDVLDFTHAIGEYVYVLTDKYKEFLARKAKRAAS